MSGKDKLKAKIGDRVAQSIGAGAPKAAPPAPAARDPRYDGLKPSKDAKEIPLAKIQPDPDQPRKEFAEGPLRTLADSIKSEGLIQPIRVRWDAERVSYLIIAGERRYRAAVLAGLTAIECVVENRILTRGAKIVQQMVENDLREGLTEIEYGNAIRDLMAEEKLGQREAAARLRIHESRVAKYLKLLDLPEVVQARVHEGELPASVAYQLGALESPVDQVEMADRIADEGLNRDSAQREIKALAERREEEKAEADTASTEVPLAEGPGDGPAAGATVVAKEPKAKAKTKAPAKKPEKLKTIIPYLDRDRGIKITAERKKGIDLGNLLLSLDHFAASLREQIKAQHIGKAAADLLRN